MKRIGLISLGVMVLLSHWAALGQALPYLDDADLARPAANPNAFNFDAVPFPRTGISESAWFGQGDPHSTPGDFTKHAMVAAAAEFPSLRQVHDLNPNALIVRYFSPRAYQNDNASIPFTGTGPASTGTGPMFAGHWLYNGFTTLTAPMSAAQLTLRVADAAKLKNNMQNGAFTQNDGGTPGTYVVIYDPPFDGTFRNAEHVFVTAINGNVATVKSGKRGYKSASSSKVHPKGARVAEHHYGQTPAATNWTYNHGVGSPVDAAGKTLNVMMADWMQANIDRYGGANLIAPHQPGGPAILYDADNWLLNKIADFDNNGTNNDNYDATGFNAWGEGLDQFYGLVRARMPDKIQIGGYYPTRGFGALNGIQLEDQAPLIGKAFDEGLARYTFHAHRHQPGPAVTEILMRAPTALYPHGQSPAPTNNRGFRNGLGMALLDDGVFSVNAKFGVDLSQERTDYWWDEYAVNTDVPGSPQFGKAVDVSTATIAQLNARKNWMGMALGSRQRIYDAAHFAESNSLLHNRNGDFEAGVPGTPAWSATGTAALGADTRTPYQGGTALKVTVGSNAISQAKSPVVPITANAEYTLSFVAKAESERQVEVGLPGYTHRILVGPEWRRYVLTVSSPVGGNLSVIFNLTYEHQALWLDDVYLFPGNTNFFVRHFEHAMVLVNGTQAPQSVKLGLPYQRILGSTRQRASDATDPNNGAMQAAGSTVTVPAWDSIVLVRTKPLAAATFVSRAAEDGFGNENGFVDAGNDTQYAIRVGENDASEQMKGFISFDTSSLPDNAIILSAKLRLKQTNMSGTPFATLGACQVDIAQPHFGDSAALESADVSAPAGAVNVAQLPRVANGQFTEAALNAAGRSRIGRTGLTQFRLHYAASTAVSQFAGYNTSEVAGAEPRLIVTYSVP